MNAEERIERLTQLARRVWPDRDARVAVGEPGDEEMHGACIVLDELGEWEQHLGITHPRALDALEAALLVLAGDGDVMLRHVCDGEHEGPCPAWHDEHAPHWVEQLAAQWEAEGAKLETMDVPNAEAVLIKCAADLRARAKGESP